MAAEEMIAALDRIKKMMKTPEEEGKRVYTVPEVQEILGISRVTTYELIKKGYFRTLKIGNQYKILKKSFDAWLEGSNGDFGGEI